MLGHPGPPPHLCPPPSSARGVISECACVCWVGGRSMKAGRSPHSAFGVCLCVCVFFYFLTLLGKRDSFSEQRRWSLVSLASSSCVSHLCVCVFVGRLFSW